MDSKNTIERDGSSRERQPDPATPAAAISKPDHIGRDTASPSPVNAGWIGSKNGESQGIERLNPERVLVRCVKANGEMGRRTSWAHIEMSETESIATSWIDRCSCGKEYDDQTPFFLFAEDQPELCLEIILRILPMIPHDLKNELFLSLAAGPLEEMMGMHGEQFIDRIEALAAQDAAFKLLLQNVWRHGMTEVVWERLRKCRE